MTAQMGLGGNEWKLFVGNIAVDCGKMQQFSLWKILVPSSANCLRRPGLLQTVNNVVPCRRILMQGPTVIGSAPPNGKIMCMPMIIPIGVIRLPTGFEASPVAVNLTTDR